jgi:hypothetical protein
MKKIALGLCLASAFALSHPLDAQTPRYSTWSNPDEQTAQNTSNVQEMIKSLRSLVNEAEKARAADPRFLQDLKDLANRFEGGGKSLIFKDDFSDGDYTKNPVWQVAKGKYWIEKGYGLRSFVEQAVASSSTSTTQERKLSNEELVIGILGAVLGGQVKTPQSGSANEQQAPQTQADLDAIIYHQTRINNAFELKMELASWIQKGHFEIMPYQGDSRKTGYRLIYQSGAKPALKLVRQYSNSAQVLAQFDDLSLEDQKNHTLKWVRKPSGVMEISVDQKLLMQVTDQGFRDDFNGLSLINHNGDFTVRSVEVFGY